jgi:LPXTG-motif cell wall-anchored protein
MSGTVNKRRFGVARIIGLMVLVAVSLLFASVAYAQIPQPQELVDPVTPSVITSPPVTISGTTAVLPVTGENILWTLGLGVGVMGGGVLLMYKTKPKNSKAQK